LMRRREVRDRREQEPTMRANLCESSMAGARVAITRKPDSIHPGVCVCVCVCSAPFVLQH